MAAALSSPSPAQGPWRTDIELDANSDSDDDDEVNTSNARIFFGALKTPELKFAHLHTPKTRRLQQTDDAASPLASHARTDHATDTLVSTTAREHSPPSPDLISFDNDYVSASNEPYGDVEHEQADLLDATMVLDAPSLSPTTALTAQPPITPSRIPLPPSPLTAEDEMQVEFLLTPKRKAAEADLAEEHEPATGPPATAQASQPDDLIRSTEATSPSMALEVQVLAEPPMTPTRAPQDEGSQLQTPARSEEEHPMAVDTPPRDADLDAPQTYGEPQTSPNEDTVPTLNISVSLSPGRLQTPKRKHADAFPGARVAEDTRKRPFPAPRAAPFASDAPRKPGPSSKPSTAMRKPVQRAPMLGSLSPETDGVLSRLLAPSSSISTSASNDGQHVNVNINIDFARLPSLGAGAAALAKENDNPAPSVQSSPGRSLSPKRVPVSVIFRSPSPPRRVLVPSPARIPSPSPPPKDASRKPAGLMATRTPLPFPFKSASGQQLPLQPQSSPVKPSAAAAKPATAKPSQLRQPSVRAVSRLPMPKPYAPPASKIPGVSAAASKTALPLPTRSAKGTGATKVVPSPPHATTTASTFGQPQSSPVRPPGPIMVRQVIPGMLGGKTDAKGEAARRIRSNFAAVIASSPTRNRQHEPQPVEKAPIPIRQVIPGTLRHYEGRPTTPPPRSAPAPAPVPAQAPAAAPVASVSLASAFSFLSGKEVAKSITPASSSATAPYAPPPSPSPPPRTRTPTSDIVLPSVPVIPSGADGPASEPAGVRRTARIRTTKPLASSSAQGVLGRASPVSRDLLPQGPQLRALTNANTVRNQAWTTTTIETLVVRKPGPRPASPSTKMRTAAEKSKEEASQERERRARRRAGQDVEAEEAEAERRRHLKAPGDDSEYETPETVRVAGRGVRWDPGLISTPERRGEDEPLVLPRSCLTPAPVKVSVPLHALRREKVVVTKFVYDDDDDEAVEPEPALTSSSEPEAATPAALRAKRGKKKATTASASSSSLSAETS
ncbi:hypothetical protein EXIGLDRAFT_832689 [Exidia glandulosa HHB12029]|uniref:Uncharacterized protein n=1 Tax=Exidia glandulosa HHB12029 TaxID=1314781 RepID=A0A165LC97_EXIGL|nr:hypothetical protein EXIGLDRAFT_832689 [Exidia glandulosa HHB12029]